MSTRITIAFCMLRSPPSTISWDQRLQRCLKACLAVHSPWLALNGLPSGFDAGQNRNCRDGAGIGRLHVYRRGDFTGESVPG